MNESLQKCLGLNKTQLAHIRQLETACNRFEGLTVKLNWSILQNRPSNQANDYLYYSGGQLVGYLALFGFGQPQVEVSAMSHPEFRRKGIFSRLLAAASDELAAHPVADFLFICERSSSSGRQCMQALGATYESSEFKMKLQAAVEPGPWLALLQLRPAQLDDLANLSRMDELCFGVSAETAWRWLAYDLAEDNRRLIVVCLGAAQIGKIALVIEPHETFIVGFCLLPEYRRLGYGRVILTQVVNQLLAQGQRSIVLEVATDNAQALSLYERCGFRPITIYDYYRLPLHLVNKGPKT